MSIIYKNYQINEEPWKGHFIAWDLNDCDNHNILHSICLESIKIEIDEYIDDYN
tara:strand:- start:220 stop:381 length:162 start_codon:yes stop_codon:yes gene_type:complete